MATLFIFIYSISCLCFGAFAAKAVSKNDFWIIFLFFSSFAPIIIILGAIVISAKAGSKVFESTHEENKKSEVIYVLSSQAYPQYKKPHFVRGELSGGQSVTAEAIIIEDKSDPTYTPMIKNRTGKKGFFLDEIC